MLALAGVKFPGNTFDGENLSDTLLGKSSASRQAPLCWRRPPDRPGGNRENLPDLAIREGRWKLLCEYDGAQPQLYDLEKDPAETTNLASQNPDLVRRLTATLACVVRSPRPKRLSAPATLGKIDALLSPSPGPRISTSPSRPPHL